MQDLDNLKYQGYGPNFHRLQVYSDTFEDLIDDSPTFKYILGTIKVSLALSFFQHKAINNSVVVVALSVVPVI